MARLRAYPSRSTGAKLRFANNARFTYDLHGCRECSKCRSYLLHITWNEPHYVRTLYIPHVRSVTSCNKKSRLKTKKARCVSNGLYRLSLREIRRLEMTYSRSPRSGHMGVKLRRFEYAVFSPN